MTPTRENRRILLHKRPHGAFSGDECALERGPIPTVGDGQILVRNLVLSIDPTIRGWMERDTYLPKIELGAVVRSAGAGVVVESKSASYKPGDRVFASVGWQDYYLCSERDRPTPIPAGVALEDALSVFGVTGMTAYFGLTEIGRAKAGETVVVSGAAGATGSVVGQLAKSLGCRVVGIAGSASKCAWLTGELGFDAAIDYKREDVGKALAATCPKGIDVYFDNVGGPILNACLARLAMRGRVVLCGAISQYESENGYGPPHYIDLISKRGRMEGFIILDYIPRFAEGAAALGRLVAEGKLKHKTTVVRGLENAPDALKRLFTGDHEGKLLVRIADDDAA